MYEIVTKTEIKDWLGIASTDTSKDSFVETLRDAVTKIVETYIQKPVITRQFTEYHDGEGKSTLLLDQYPVYLTRDSNNDPSNMSIYDDTDRGFSSSYLISPEDYTVDEDTGLVKLYGSDTFFADGKNNVKAVYWAGLSRFEVVSGQNSYLVLNEDETGDTTTDITAGKYSAEDLASQIQSDLNDNSSLSGTYTVTYSHETQKFTIAVTGVTSVAFKYSSSTIAELIGFSADQSGTSLVSDTPVTGVPHDIRLAAQQIALYLYEMSGQSSTHFQNIVSRATPEGGTLRYLQDQLPPVAKMILDRYRRVSV
ncbi:MAG: hypothetical protein GXO75_15445 [Calditrichaeota bacterium]|nr:hypothetical protein [Calditrichota bacterium]